MMADKICPYRNKYFEVQNQTFTYEDGSQTHAKYETATNRKYELCLEEQCGALYDGHCNYKG